MDALARALRTRAQELGLSHAAIARRIGMSERRYAHYVNGRNEPDLATLVRIAKALQTSPNELLGFAVETKRSKRTLLRDRLSAAAGAMDDRQLEMTVVQAEAVAAS
jgi:transcriptional regulator with XRE-family HTH domain